MIFPQTAAFTQTIYFYRIRRVGIRRNGRTHSLWWQNCWYYCEFGI